MLKCYDKELRTEPIENQYLCGISVEVKIIGYQ